MGRLTVRLPDTLAGQLRDMAASEGVSLNQYIVYALSCQVTAVYAVRPTPAAQVAEQRAAYNALLQSLGQATFAEIQAALDEREEDSARELDPQIVARLQERLARQPSPD